MSNEEEIKTPEIPIENIEAESDDVNVIDGSGFGKSVIQKDIDVVLSHTCPKYYEPVEWFLPTINQSKVDKSTEIWLDSIFERLNFKKWYCGHYHGSKKIDGFQFMYKDFDSFMI